MNRKSTRGISDVVATVIIVAATVAIALVAIAYFTGIVGGATHTQKLQAIGNPQLVISGSNTKNTTYFLVVLKNTGDKKATIAYITVAGHYIDLAKNPISIAPNEIKTVNETIVTDSNDFQPGVSYHYEIGITGGSTLSGDVIAVQKG
ncbi:MAG: hypothetical protein GSR79_03130 [Desulfurococcales archaeon]|nr:hypothetical protein [Desulfurococcales archaeon]